MLSVVLAVLAAIANASASVAQRSANRDEPDEESLSFALIRDLLHRPVWFGGLLLVIGGFLLQAVALGGGAISLVEPLLVLELPATLVLARLVFHADLRPRDYAAAGTMTAGVVLLIVCLSPSRGHPARVSAGTWIIGIAVTLGVTGLLAWRGRRSRYAGRAAYLGTATGVAFGLTAALMTGMDAAFRHGIGGVLTAWQTYLMAVTGLTAMFLLQSALQAGRLVSAQPGITLSDPLVAIGWGLFAFGERPHTGGWIVGMLGGVALLAAGTIRLAGSPAVAGRAGGTEEATGGAPGPDRRVGSTGRR